MPNRGGHGEQHAPWRAANYSMGEHGAVMKAMTIIEIQTGHPAGVCSA